MRTCYCSLYAIEGPNYASKPGVPRTVDRTAWWRMCSLALAGARTRPDHGTGDAAESLLQIFEKPQGLLLRLLGNAVRGAGS